MGLVLTLATWMLALATAAALSTCWRGAAARVLAFGVLAFSTLVAAFQIPGVVAAATGMGTVGTMSAFIASALLCAIVWLSPALRRMRGQGASVAPASRRRLGPTARRAALPFAALAAFYGIAISSALSAPPRGWDVLTYHLPKAVAWLQSGDLGIHGSTGAYYPGNAQIILMSVLSTGSDRLAPLVQLPFAALAGAAVYGVARELGARVGSATLAACVFLFAPMVFFQTTVAKDDLIVTALVVSGAYFLLRAIPRGAALRNRSAGEQEEQDGRATDAPLCNAAMSGLSFGLALGTKYSILPFVMGAVPVAVAAMAVTRTGARRTRAVAAAAVAFVAAVLAPSLFWFVRNAVASGNPIEPLTLNPGAWIGAAGLDQQFQFVPNLASWWIWPWLDRHIGGSYSGSAGFGWAFALLFLPGLIAAALRTRARGRWARWVTLVALIVMGVVAWWFGKHHLPRFLLPMAALSCAPVALLIDSIPRRAKAVRLALVVVTVAAVGASAAETMRVVFGSDDITWSHRGGVSRMEFYAIPEVIYELPPGTKVLLLRPTDRDYHQTFRYPLTGALPGNTVVMEDDVGFTLDRTSGESIVRGLSAAGVEYVFLRTIGMKPFTTWFDENPRHFRLVHDEVGRSYPWYRESSAYTETGEYLGPGTAVTRIYKFLAE